MPFDSKSAQAAGLIGGAKSAAIRWKGKDPSTVRNKRMILTVTGEEFGMMNAKAAAAGISRTELIVRAVEKYRVEDG